MLVQSKSPNVAGPRSSRTPGLMTSGPALFGLESFHQEANIIQIRRSQKQNRVNNRAVWSANSMGLSV